MIESLSSKIDLTINASFFSGITSYGKVLVGDKSFEYYNDRNVNDYIQIPWEEVEYIAAQVFFKRWITRFVIFTKRNGKFSFSTKDNKKTLKVVSNYIDKSKMVKSKTFLEVIILGFKRLIKRR
ncbi:DUF956 family protein [Streptobacillus moniliformis]|uniref:DUF956 family protein n=1 Tax=Streptobacillus moniliformis TaxID=34105 RepID=UPI0007E337BD|nr:DUF956 family protein [Streptobacillus moniliformis]